MSTAHTARGRARGRLLGGLLGVAAAVLFASSCSRQTVAVQLHPLQASGQVSYVCRDASGNGVPLSRCNPQAILRDEVHLYALVTQTATGEVAVIRVPLDPAFPRTGDGFVDIDPAVPGWGFLHVGALPGHIVTTPGGDISFVGTGEAGKPAIFGLATSCLGAPGANEPDRDISTWAACSLSSTPGSMAVVVEPAPSGATDPGALCDGTTPTFTSERQSCSVDAKTLATDDGGRAKLVVALPQEGSLAVIDAGWIAQIPEGEFPPCKVEVTVKLGTELPSELPVQVLPADLVVPADLSMCTNFQVPTPDPVPPVAQPAGFALDDKGLLYVADSGVPLIHRVDFSKPCAPVPREPLLPRSLDNPKRVVTTSRLAVSPLTPAGKQFVYAIDQYDQPTASVMAFDVSPGSTDRTPLVRAGAPFLPFEPPDRIQTPAAPRDLTFVLRDRPQIDPVTGNTVKGVSCDPTPGHTGVGKLYRPVTDYSSGARAAELRGVFASVLLTNGQISIVDVEDFDAPCRRPVEANHTSEEDYRGCKGDPDAIASYVDSAGATVTGEVSCHMVEPHRIRSASLGISDSTHGVHAPALRGFPQLKAPDAAATYAPLEKPTLQGLDFGPTAPASVFVNTIEYARESANSPLDISPANHDQFSVTLPYQEPRAYPASDSLTLTYEGAVTGVIETGRLSSDDAEGLRLDDFSVGYCDFGVNDEELMRGVAADRFGMTVKDDITTFGQEHADYVELTGDFPATDDTYWTKQVTCSRAQCVQEFGAFDAKELSSSRDFRIVDAQQQVLMLEPRLVSLDASVVPSDPAYAGLLKQRTDLATCCFPSGVKYVVRASNQWVLRTSTGGFRTKVVPAWETNSAGEQILNCVVDCNPRKKFWESRVFEICLEGANCFTGQPPSKYPTAAHDLTCRFTQPATPRAVGWDTSGTPDPALACAYQSPLARFAVYRGVKPSVRDMVFSWQTTGGFSPMKIDLAGLSSVVSPQAIVGLDQMNWLTVVDGASLGLTLVSLDTLAPLSPPLN